MRIRNLIIAVAAAGALAGASVALARPIAPGSSQKTADGDPYLWLAKIHSPRALAWVRQQNAISDRVLKRDPAYRAHMNTILGMLNNPARIAEPTLRGRWVYNFWQDPTHVRGIWRRASIASYDSGHPAWHTLLDLDALDKQAHKDWVWKGADCTRAFDQCLVRLSPGGGDAVVIREFDPKTQKFIVNGFKLSLAKSQASYVNRNTILFATNFGPGSMTPASYPRIIKLWHRGEPLTAAKTVFEARPTDMGADPIVLHGPYGTISLIICRPSFFKADYYDVADDGHLIQIKVPEDAQLVGVTNGQLIFTLQDAWKTPAGATLAQGALFAVAAPGFAKASTPQPVVLYTPGTHEAIGDVAAGRDAVYAAIYKDVTGQVLAFHYANGRWRKGRRLTLPTGGSTTLASVNAWGPQAYIQFESFTQPPTLYFDDGSHQVKAIYALPERFNPKLVSVAQHWVKSKDGTKIPYFLIRPAGAKGPLPTILYGYGGFQLSLFPWYWDDGYRPLDAVKNWVLKGGAIAVANIRGGGEFGPAWHQAALKYHRQRAFDDFEAVAADIEHHDWSTPKMLGIVGASNGGLLVSTVMVQRPDLLAAVVCQRPLIDMLRYTHYGAGASWEGEYGNPANPKMRAYIRRYSPFENVKAGVQYPPALFITETSDDRVTPVFARMMAAKMEAQGHQVLFNEEAEGGHGPGSTHAEEANYWALTYTFFQEHLGLK